MNMKRKSYTGISNQSLLQPNKDYKVYTKIFCLNISKRACKDKHFGRVWLYVFFKLQDHTETLGYLFKIEMGPFLCVCGGEPIEWGGSYSKSTW